MGKLRWSVLTCCAVAIFLAAGGLSPNGANAQEAAPATSDTAVEAPSGERKTSGGLFGGESSFVSDDEPIDIAADELELNQEEQVAIFTGNVDAVQGTLNLKSDKLIIYYTQTSDDTGGASGEASDRTSVRQIDAQGNVRLATLTETAGGDWAIYEIEKGEITLGGKVTLTRGENILQGAKLIVDVETGNSRLLSSQSGGQRVRGLFIPGSEDVNENNDSEGSVEGAAGRNGDG